MKGIIILSAVCMQLGWISAYPSAQQGVGAYAYQDSAGNRYGGTYGLKDGQVVGNAGEEFMQFGPMAFGPASFGPTSFGPDSFQDLDEFFPEYFRNFENLLQEALGNHLEHQRLALNSAHKAFDLTSNRAGYIPNFPFRFQHYSMPDFSAPSLNMANYGPNSAFASGAAGPGYRHQMAAINPGNPNIPNVDVVNFSDMQEPGKPGFYSVSSKSYSSSSNVNGQEKTNRGAETMVNDNGKITSYKVRN